jgi:hypothetical protein
LHVRPTRTHQIEIAVCLGSLGLLVPLAALDFWSGGQWRGMALICGLLLLVQPYALLRLLERFMPMSDRLRWTAIGCAGGGALLLLLLPYQRILLGAAAFYFTAAQGYAAWEAFDESCRRVGVTRVRLRLAAAGAAAAIVLVALKSIGWTLGASVGPWLQILVAIVVALGFGLGIAPPRRVLRLWQQAELRRFLHMTARRAPRERESHLADDLNEAAMRSVTATTTAVMLGSDDLATQAASDPVWEGVQVVPGIGLVGIAMGGVDPVVGPPKEAEPPLNTLATGDVVTVVPIARSSPRWGVLVVEQRRASTYQPDELSLLGALCRHASDVLDHARLVQDERERQQRLAHAPVAHV